MTGRRALWVTAAVVVTAGIVVALYWFTPWKLFIDHRVNEALPAVATQSIPAQSPASAASGTAASPRLTASGGAQAVLLARGAFVSHEHSTRGTASIVRQPDGSRVLAIANLNTSDGPVLKVWLTDREVTKDGWHVFDDGKFVDLGGLKGNVGNQLYPIPDDTDLSAIRSVSIWCDRFNVSFGAAELVKTKGSPDG